MILDMTPQGPRASLALPVGPRCRPRRCQAAAGQAVLAQFLRRPSDREGQPNTFSERLELDPDETEPGQYQGLTPRLREGALPLAAHDLWRSAPTRGHSAPPRNWG